VTRQDTREVLVTSAGSALGHAIAEALAGEPAVHRAVCAHDAAFEPPWRSARGVEHVRLDLTHPRAVRDLLFSEHTRGIDTLVHVPYVPPAPVRPDGHAIAESVRSTELLLRIAEEHPRISRFVLVSSAAVYRVDTHEPTLIAEDHPLELAKDAAPALRERVETDLVVASRIGASRLTIAVLRCAEILAGGCGGQLHDYLGSRVCLRPLGYDPMINVLSLDDAANAVRLCALARESGVFNVPGFDTLPLSELIHKCGRIGVPLPGPALSPLYALRARATAFRFRYAPERQRFHFGAVLDGRKARDALGYLPARPVTFDRRSRESSMSP
jgi:UDP-glucose 4-epimerase